MRRPEAGRRIGFAGQARMTRFATDPARSVRDLTCQHPDRGAARIFDARGAVQARAMLPASGVPPLYLACR